MHKSFKEEFGSPGSSVAMDAHPAPPLHTHRGYCIAKKNAITECCFLSILGNWPPIVVLTEGQTLYLAAPWNDASVPHPEP